MSIAPIHQSPATLIETVADHIVDSGITVVLEARGDDMGDTTFFRLRGSPADREYLADFIATLDEDEPTFIEEKWRETHVTCVNCTK